MKATSFALVLSLISPCFITHAISPTDLRPAVLPSQKININQADAAALAQVIKGIGKKRAQAIVQYRQARGPFKSLEELALVRGIGKQFVKKHLIELQRQFLIG